MINMLRQWLKSDQPAPDDSAVTARILMVCTGNICRSPTAEGVLRAKLKQAGLEALVRVDSAGTHGYHTAEPPDPRAIQAAAKRGYNIADLQARPMRPEDFSRFTWLLAMDQTNMDWLQKRGTEGATARPALLMPLARKSRGLIEVPDPYFGGPAGFERVLDLVEDACDGVVDRLRAGRHLD